MGNKVIRILLTCYPDKVSKFMRGLGRWQYSHASINTDETGPEFYSFTGKKGFVVENFVLHPTYKGQAVYCAYYEIPVPDHVCHKISLGIREHLRNKAEYRYSMFCAAMIYLRWHVNIHRKNTCTGFVSDMLKKGEFLPEKFCRKLVSPEDFLKHLRDFKCYEGDLATLTKNVLRLNEAKLLPGE
ncbi:MAG: hypothetical protein IKH65_03005 [Clostridia bacterium]|nr:hypothetical protein [Clostridia bacterium]